MEYRKKVFLTQDNVEGIAKICKKLKHDDFLSYLQDRARLRQWGAGNVYLLVLSSWKINIAENPIAVMGF